MASFNKFQPFVANLANGNFNLGSDTMKVCLSDSAPVATYSTYSQLTEISSGNGYSTGGATVTLTSSTQTSGTYSYIATCANPTWTASGGAIAQFRYIILYDSTPASKYLIGWWDYGSEVNLASGNTFYVQFNTTTGILQLA
jgi:hypothetical protein